MHAARVRFAAEGLTASLRAIAGDAGVNLGLVHRHFGSKEALVSEVLSDVAARGRRRLAAASSLPEALEMIARAAGGGDDDLAVYVRLLAWILLAGHEPRDFQRQFPAMSDVLALGQPDDRRLVLLAVAAVFGWEVFAPHLAEMLGYATRPEADTEFVGVLRDRLLGPAGVDGG